MRSVADDLHDPDMPRGIAHHIHCADGTMLCLHSDANHGGASCVLAVQGHKSLQNGKIHPQISKFAGFILLGGTVPCQRSDAIASEMIVSWTVARNASAANAE